MGYEFKTKRLVEFVDTDMAGILHFSNYFRYMEGVEHAFFRSLGLRVHGHRSGGRWGWARRLADCSYARPLRYEDEVELHLLVREKSARSIRYTVIFRRIEAGGPVEVARGSMTVVCVEPDAEGVLRSVPIPADVDARVQVAPPDVLG